MAGGRCCACNGSCHPGRSLSCHNPFGVPSAPQRSPSPSPCGPSSSSSSSLDVSVPSSESVISSASALPSFEAICCLNVPLLLYIPKGTRNGVLSSILQSIIACPSNLVAWAKLFMLPKCAPLLDFAVIRKISLTSSSSVCQPGEMVTTCLSGLKSPRSPTHLSNPSVPPGVRRACRAAASGLFRKALNSHGLTAPSLERRDELLLKHPQSPAHCLPDATPTALSPSPPASLLTHPSSPDLFSSSPTPSCPSSSPPPLPLPPPLPPPPTPFSPPAPSQLPAAVLASIKSFPADTAPGLRPSCVSS